jgi:hypothetical protein
MRCDNGDDTVRRAIGGDTESVAWIAEHGSGAEHVVVVVMAALLASDITPLDRARKLAATGRDRQIVEIARAHLEGRTDQVGDLARDHLADFPDSLIVAWIASL